MYLQVNTYKFMTNRLEVAYFIFDRDILSWWRNSIVLFFISIYQLYYDLTYRLYAGFNWRCT